MSHYFRLGALSLLSIMVASNVHQGANEHLSQPEERLVNVLVPGLCQWIVGHSKDRRRIQYRDHLGVQSLGAPIIRSLLFQGLY